MFDYDCPACEKQQLLFPSQLDGIVNDEHGITVLLTCWCGAAGAVRTGRAATPASRPAPRHALAS